MREKNTWQWQTDRLDSHVTTQVFASMSAQTRAATIVVFALIVTLACFDVTLRPQFHLAREVSRPDPAQEARYLDCISNEDSEIHHRAFDTIDNPDVQREFISMQRERAELECRGEFPEQMITMHEPFHFNVVELRSRFRR
jgi:hypothetical protein